MIICVNAVLVLMMSDNVRRCQEEISKLFGLYSRYFFFLFSVHCRLLSVGFVFWFDVSAGLAW